MSARTHYMVLLMQPLRVLYTAPGEVVSVTLEQGAPMTVEAAIRASGLLERFPDIDMLTHKVACFGRLCQLGDTVGAGDRVEITRPLLCQDPKEKRRSRLKNKTSEGKASV